MERLTYIKLEMGCKREECPVNAEEIVPAEETKPFTIFPGTEIEHLCNNCYFCNTTASVRPATQAEIDADNSFLEP